jgi:ribosomal protein S12 methylthiotransferase accessory factor
MSSIVVTFPGGKRVDAAVGDYVIHTDQSREHGGDGSAPEPFTLFLSALATCAGIYVLGFCQTRNLPTSGIRLEQESAFDDAGKLTHVKLDIVLPPDFPEKYVTSVRAAANGCKVKKLLADPPVIDVVARRAIAAA